MLEIKLLGQFHVQIDGVPIDISSRPLQSLLAYLVLNAGSSQRRARLAGILWPESDETIARKNLSQALWRLRKAIGDDYLLTNKDSIAFKASANSYVDVHILEDDKVENTAALINSVSVYKGRLLPGLYEDWVIREGERLWIVFESKMQKLLDRLIEEDRWNEVLEWGRYWILVGQPREPAYRALMLAYAEMDDISGVGTIYERCVKVFQEKYGVMPSAETQKLYQHLLHKGDKSLLGSKVYKEEQLTGQYLEQKEKLSGKKESISDVAEGLTQQIRFCTTPDGVRLAYATVGQGPVLVRAATYLTHLEYDWDSPVWRHWLRGLSENHQLVRYDQRGCGLSDWEVDDFSLEAEVQDLETVVDALGLARFSLLGLSHSGPVAIAYTVRHPEKVSHLILYGTYALGFLKSNPTQKTFEEAQMYLNLIKHGWGRNNPAFRQVYSTMFLPDGTAEQINWFNDLQRISTSPENAIRRDIESFNYDVYESASLITVPTLVIHPREDGAVSFERGRELAALIPKARFVALDSKNHILLEDEPAWPRFLQETNRFLGTMA